MCPGVQESLCCMLHCDGLSPMTNLSGLWQWHMLCTCITIHHTDKMAYVPLKFGPKARATILNSRMLILRLPCLCSWSSIARWLQDSTMGTKILPMCFHGNFQPTCFHCWFDSQSSHQQNQSSISLCLWWLFWNSTQQRWCQSPCNLGWNSHQPTFSKWSWRWQHPRHMGNTINFCHTRNYNTFNNKNFQQQWWLTTTCCYISWASVWQDCCSFLKSEGECHWCTTSSHKWATEFSCWTTTSSLLQPC